MAETLSYREVAVQSIAESLRHLEAKGLSVCISLTSSSSHIIPSSAVLERLAPVLHVVDCPQEGFSSNHLRALQLAYDSLKALRISDLDTLTR